MENKGFTLIELTVSTALMSIIFLLLFSLTVDPQSQPTLEESIYQIANDIIYGKEYAKTHNINLGFIICTTNNYYRIYRGQEIILVGYIPKEYSISTGFPKNMFTIKTNGGVNMFGSITLSDNDGNYVWLTTTINTGRVKVYLNE